VNASVNMHSCDVYFHFPLLVFDHCLMKT